MPSTGKGSRGGKVHVNSKGKLVYGPPLSHRASAHPSGHGLIHHGKQKSVAVANGSQGMHSLRTKNSFPVSSSPATRHLAFDAGQFTHRANNSGTAKDHASARDMHYKVASAYRKIGNTDRAVYHSDIAASHDRRLLNKKLKPVRL